MHPLEHYDACIQDSQATIQRLSRQLSACTRTSAGRKYRAYLQERIACETKAIEIFERDKANTVREMTQGATP